MACSKRTRNTTKTDPSNHRGNLISLMSRPSGESEQAVVGRLGIAGIGGIISAAITIIFVSLTLRRREVAPASCLHRQTIRNTTTQLRSRLFDERMTSVDALLNRIHGRVRRRRSRTRRLSRHSPVHSRHDQSQGKQSANSQLQARHQRPPSGTREKIRVWKTHIERPTSDGIHRPGQCRRGL